MNNNLIQLLKSREQEFDKEFVEERTPIENTKGEFTCKIIASAKNIKSFNATTISLLLNSIKEEVERRKRFSQWNHTRGSHADDHSDTEPCDCMDEEKRISARVYDNISTLLSETISEIQETPLNNMEPEKEYIHDARHEACNPKFCPFARPVKFVEPEKKDVWKLENWEKKCPKCRRTLPDSFIKKLRTHFIPRAEVVERIDKLEPKLWDAKGKEFVPKSDLLDLLTQEK